ncbi:MAG: SPASM domain-containing protein [Ruminococcus sp.]|nr:SPASM domain-containing protein [Ruminococcus sp.]
MPILFSGIDKMNFIERVKQLQQEYGKIYLYGTGQYGERTYHLLQKNQIAVCGFIVTHKEQCNKQIFDLKIESVDQIDFMQGGIIISAGRYNTLEILKLLKERNCEEERIVCACEYLDNRKLEEEFYSMPTIDITTVVGCKINCRYCPQKLLIKNYYKDNVQRDRIMSMETFTTCLKHLPPQCNMMFCGMAEPFLNPACADMIIMAYKAEIHVDLYTTLSEISMEELERIWDIPMGFVNIHVPDENGYASIPVSEEYFELLEKALNHRRKDGKWFVNMCNAQGEPHFRVKELCKQRYEIATALHDRAGNLDDDNLLHKRKLQGKLSCSQCGQALDHNILLPDGTLLLCCMDYGMKHILGNLREQTYEEIRKGRAAENVFEALKGNEHIDLLCRNCSFAREVN